ncbi:MAG: HlyC/CorC family transporter [Spirochaetes bacterium]|nr:HlyC/CorC family transporter [Spirochaetota bacterium]
MIGNAIAIAILLLFWAFFAGSETAFVSTNRFKLYNLKKRGKRPAQLASHLLERPERLLSTTLVGTNLALVLSSNLVARLYLDMFGQPKPLLSVITITLLSLIFCEVLPKNLALIRSLQWTLASTVPLFIFYLIFFPIGKIFSFLTGIIIRLVGITQTGLHPGLFKKKEDVKFFISTHLEPHYTEDESRYFEDTLDFGEKRLSDIMVPLVDIFALPDTSKVRDCFQFIKKHQKYSIPVYRERIDNIIGMLTARELVNTDKDLKVTEVMDEPVFIPENKNISELYREAYEEGFSTVFAVDEYGGITGLASIYDIGEEIIGRIDALEERSLIVRIQEGEYICDGDAEIVEVERLLSIDIAHEEFLTLNGLFLSELGKIPQKGDTLNLQGYSFTVVRGSRKKADLIRVKRVT